MKKGFTLIELLAVIVILAIIALIATPIVLSIIKDSKESSQLRSAEMYLKGLETSIATATLESKVVKTGSYSIMNNGNVCLEYKDNKCTNELKVEMNGETPKSGKVTVSNGQVIYLILNYENKTIVRNNDELVYSYKESSNIEVPDLYNGTLTPVIYDGDNWIIADVKDKWYDYSKQEWANAVILKSDSTKKVGDKLIVDGESPDVLAMLVWIPRYEYKIEGKFGKGGTSADSPGEIEVNFINTNIKKASETYRIHPAFNFGGTDISGIWVGKFELSHKTKPTTSMNCIDENCSEVNNIRILPNVQSLRNNTVSSFFYGIRSMSMEGNVFGIDKNITDTHMMKNSEWGVVAYLSQSKYGKYGNSDYTGAEKEVYINNSSDYYTGRSGGSYSGNTRVNAVYKDQTSEEQYNAVGYYTYDGYLLQYNSNLKTEPETRNMKKIASTTGTIYGVYDMSGGRHEFVMGVLQDEYGNPIAANSGFNGAIYDFNSQKTEDKVDGINFPDKKYYDLYSSVAYKECNGDLCYGHAIDETKFWYGNFSNGIWIAAPWYVRGGNFKGQDSGIFYRTNQTGRIDQITSRVILCSY